MLGSIIGDIVGSSFEFSDNRNKSENFSLYEASSIFTDKTASIFTDDTVLTIAVAQAILCGEDYGQSIRKFGCKYP